MTPTSKKNQRPLFDLKNWPTPWSPIFFISSVLLVPLSAISMLADIHFGWDLLKQDIWRDPDTGRATTINVLDFIIFGAWLLLPPMWFFTEYVMFSNKADDPHRIADFKYKQELSQKVWSALLVVFGAILYLKYRINLPF